MKTSYAIPLGLRRGMVKLSPHDERWGALAKETVSKLIDGLRGIALGIEHVGSTAIPGIHAKPILDFAVGVEDLDSVLPFLDRLRDCGIHLVHDARPRELLFAEGKVEADFITSHIHVIPFDGEEWRNYLDFRDYLLAHQDEAKRYETLKIALAERYGDDRKQYTAGKGDAIAEILEKAHRWRACQNDQD